MVLLLITRLFFFILLPDTPQPGNVQDLSPDYLFQESNGPIYGLLQYALGTLLENRMVNGIMAALFILWNASLLNMLLIRNSAFEENTYIPAALYIIVLSGNADNYFISPQLIASSFLLMALIFIHQHLKYRNSDEKVLSIGCTLALSSLAFLPNAWYLILSFILLLFYSGTVGRRYLLLLWGFIMILLITWLPFEIGKTGTDFWTGYFSGLLIFNTDQPFLMNMGIVLGFPILLSLKSSISNLAGMGMTNNQITVKRVFTWIGLFGLASLIFQSQESAASATPLVISITYFVTEHLLGVKRKWLAELTFLGILVLMLAMLFYGPFY